VRRTLFALALLVAPATLHPETLPVWNVQWSSTQSFSAGAGVLFGASRGDGFDVGKSAWLLELRPGLDGGALSVGWFPVAVGVSGYQFAGAGLRATLLRTWGTPAGVARDRTLGGLELSVAWVVKASVGVLRPLDARGPRATLLTWGIGFGL